jgi:hypothetical protein
VRHDRDIVARHTTNRGQASDLEAGGHRRHYRRRVERCQHALVYTSPVANDRVTIGVATAHRLHGAAAHRRAIAWNAGPGQLTGPQNEMSREFPIIEKKYFG